MNRIKGFTVWLRRIAHSRGFGIQSPSDYWFVRYVINEHWPYYQYATLGGNDDWLRKKLGLLYFRIANWRQPAVVSADDYQSYFSAGCRKAVFGADADLMLLSLQTDGWHTKFEDFVNSAGEQSLLIVESIWEKNDAWQQIVTHDRVTVTFDLYYCGLVMFDRKRNKHNYIINF